MKVAIVVIGDELLLGKVQDTNSSLIARTIAPKGWQVTSVETVGDDIAAIKGAVLRGMDKANVVLTTGGIGPTKDDITRRALMEIFPGELHMDPETLENVKLRVAERGFPINRLTELQAMVPTSCRVVQNRFGTAPLMWFERDGKVVVTLPGVPFETAQAFPQDLFPELRRHFGDDREISHHTFLVTGYRESELAELLEPLESQLPADTHLAYLPEPGLVRLRVDSEQTLPAEVEEIRKLLGGHIISEKDIPLAQVLIEKAAERGIKIGSAESCTGGKISSLITSIPGASEVMQGAVVSYSNEVKHNLLGVPMQMIAQHGAVSEPVARAMAQGAQKALGATLTVATSGIAGPGGGTPEKPVGTVCIAAAFGRNVISETAHFSGNRQRVIDQATARALTMAISLLNQ